MLLFFLPLSLSIRYSTIHFFPTYSGRLYLRTVLMIKPPRKHLVCEDLISPIISVHPQGLVPIDTNIWQDKMCLIHYEWATNISVYICSVTEPAVSCTSQLVLKFWLLQKALLSSAWVFLNATPCLHQMIVALAFCSKRWNSSAFLSNCMHVSYVILATLLISWFDCNHGSPEMICDEVIHLHYQKYINTSWVYVWLQFGSTAHSIQSL